MAYNGVEMHVLVRIGVIELQPGGGKRLELRADFRGELPAQARAGPKRPLADMAATPLTNSVSPTGLNAGAASARYMAPH